MALSDKMTSEELRERGCDPKAHDLLELPCMYRENRAAGSGPENASDCLEICTNSAKETLLKVREAGTIVTIALSQESLAKLARWCGRHLPS